MDNRHFCLSSKPCYTIIMRTRRVHATYVLIGLLGFGVVLLSLNFFFRPLDMLFPAPASMGDESQDITMMDPEPTPDPIADWMAQLSDQEKIDQLLVLPYTIDTTSTVSADPLWSADVKPGFIALFGSQVDIIRASQSISKLKFGQDPSKPAAAFAVDHEGGKVQRLSGNGFTVLPSWQSLCEEGVENNRPLLRQSASELASLGVSVVFAPVVDVASRSAVLGSRICSGNEDQVASASALFVEEFLQQGVWSTLKHYPGIGSVRRDLHKQFDTQTVTTSDVAPFHYVLRRHPTMPVMTSWMGVVGLEYQEPCGLNPECVALLRDTYQKALVFSDSLTMEAAAYDPATQEYSRPLSERAVRAIEAGNHVLVFGPDLSIQDLQELRQVLLSLYQLELTPNTFRNQVDAAVTRALEFKQYQLLQPSGADTNQVVRE